MFNTEKDETTISASITACLPCRVQYDAVILDSYDAGEYVAVILPSSRVQSGESQGRLVVARKSQTDAQLGNPELTDLQ